MEGTKIWMAVLCILHQATGEVFPDLAFPDLALLNTKPDDIKEILAPFDPTLKNPCFKSKEDGSTWHCLPYFNLLGMTYSGTFALRRQTIFQAHMCKKSRCTKKRVSGSKVNRLNPTQAEVLQNTLRLQDYRPLRQAGGSTSNSEG